MRPQSRVVGKAGGQTVGLALRAGDPCHLRRGVAPGGQGALPVAANHLQTKAQVHLDRLSVQVERLLADLV